MDLQSFFFEEHASVFSDYCLALSTLHLSWRRQIQIILPSPILNSITSVLYPTLLHKFFEGLCFVHIPFSHNLLRTPIIFIFENVETAGNSMNLLI